MKAFKISNNKLLMHQTPYNLIIIDKISLICVSWILGFSLIAIMINHFFFHYQGNDYIQGKMVYILTAYSCLYLLICHLIPQLNRFKTKCIDLLYITFMFFILQIFTNAVQFTPFSSIDAQILSWEPLPLATIIAWTKQHPQIQAYLILIYASLTRYLLDFPFFILIFCSRESIHGWIKFVFISTCLGFTFYYFFPSCGPGSIIPNKALFFQSQLDNTLKFQQIHLGLLPTTDEGGLIAFPSFHVIWSWSIVRLLAHINSKLYKLGLIWFVGICLSCVCLGWHYSIDILASLGLIYFVEKCFFHTAFSKAQMNLAAAD